MIYGGELSRAVQPPIVPFLSHTYNHTQRAVRMRAYITEYFTSVRVRESREKAKGSDGRIELPSARACMQMRIPVADVSRLQLAVRETMDRAIMSVESKTP